jgi:hypothetical protein
MSNKILVLISLIIICFGTFLLCVEGSVYSTQDYSGLSEVKHDISQQPSEE